MEEYNFEDNRYKQRYEYKDNSQSNLFKFISTIIALFIISKLLNDVIITSFFALVISAFFIVFFNHYLKPVLVILTLPITVLTLGLFYPIVNVLILSLVDWLVGSGFELGGLLNILIVSFLLAIINSLISFLFHK
ncbi:MAG: phage holin family protein [Mycoplasmatales bacterium]